VSVGRCGVGRPAHNMVVRAYDFSGAVRSGPDRTTFALERCGVVDLDGFEGGAGGGGFCEGGDEAVAVGGEGQGGDGFLAFEG
jgi:hypothetical protein